MHLRDHRRRCEHNSHDGHSYYGSRPITPGVMDAYCFGGAEVRDEDIPRIMRDWLEGYFNESVAPASVDV